jgi:hypothetical protein
MINDCAFASLAWACLRLEGGQRQSKASQRRAKSVPGAGRNDCGIEFAMFSDSVDHIRYPYARARGRRLQVENPF